MPTNPWETATVHAGGCEMSAEVLGSGPVAPFVCVTITNARTVTNRREHGETTARLCVRGEATVHLDIDGARELIERLEAALRHPERPELQEAS